MKPFDPYKGRRFGLAGQKRVLILGCSHYCNDYIKQVGCSCKCKRFHVQSAATCRCNDFTKFIVEKYIRRAFDKGDSGWRRTFTKFLNSCFPAHITNDKARVGLLEKVMFANYVCRVETNAANKPDHKMLDDDRNFQRLCEITASNRIEYVIVWGARLRTLLSVKLSVEGDRFAKQRVKFLFVAHPSCHGYYKAVENKVADLMSQSNLTQSF